MYTHLNSILMNEGTIVISKEDLPIPYSKWEELDQMMNNSIYEDIEKGDTEETTSLKVFRVKKSGETDIYNNSIMDIINSTPFKNYLSKIIGLKNYIVDRCQCHVYKTGDFVSKHTDADSNKEFKFAFMMILDEEYKGGEFCVHLSKDQIRTYKPNKYSLILTRCNLAHEVKKVISGVRRTIVGFIKPIESGKEKIK